MSSVTRLATKGVLWVGISQMSVQVFRFVFTMLLARLLVPDDFGIIGMAAIFIGLVSTVNELGLSASIVQRKEVHERHLSTSFWTSIFVGLVLFVMTLIISPYVADFFKTAIVQPILDTLSVTFIIGSFVVVHSAMLTKNLDFKRLAKAEVFSELVSGSMAVYLAFTGFGVWSLVWRTIIGNLIFVVLLWTINPWRPTMSFDLKSFNELFGFGANVIGSNFVNYAAKNVDYLVIGKFLGAMSLGYYTLAYQMITFPLYRVSVVITRVMFPAFSMVQGENERLGRGYLAVTKYLSLITFPMIAGIFIVSPEFIPIVMGEKWVQVILPLQILCLAGALQSVGVACGPVLLSKGRADLSFKWSIIKLFALIAAILVGIKYGIIGVAVTVTILSFLFFWIMQKIVNDLIGMDFRNYLKALYPATLNSVIMIISVYLFKEIAFRFLDLPSIAVLACSVILGTFMYLAVLRLLYNDIILELRSLMRQGMEKME